MVTRNPHLAKLNAGYLFPEINKRKQSFLKKFPQAELISLGIGDTTYPLHPCITERLQKYASSLSTQSGYSGYGPEQGSLALRKKIAEQLYHSAVDPDEVFISDGAKCDIGRLQLLFGDHCTIAVQDPTYPVYVDTGVVLGQTGSYDKALEQYRNISYMPCLPNNNFFPQLEQLGTVDLIYFCSPNNPTGSVATREQLSQLVAFAKERKAIVIFDAAYSFYIQDPNLPRSIYEIPGAKEVAIEVSSFSKMAGFTGLRLGWSIVPRELSFSDGYPVKKDWERIQSTFFNGASNVIQEGGIVVLENQSLAIDIPVNYYMENARLIRDTWLQLGFSTYGGEHAPYVWVGFPGKRSWDLFEEILEQAHVVTTPGSGFGKSGEGFIRFSAFGRREQTETALHRLHQHFSSYFMPMNPKSSKSDRVFSPNAPFHEP